MWDTSPDQFRMSRLKEGERVCGGRGQFGKQPLWDLNTFSKPWMRLVRCGMFTLRSWNHRGRSNSRFSVRIMLLKALE
jgi:hypothetical protein